MDRHEKHNRGSIPWRQKCTSRHGSRRNAGTSQVRGRNPPATEWAQIGSVEVTRSGEAGLKPVRAPHDNWRQHDQKKE